MSAPVKFLFDTDFGRERPPADRSALIADAEARGYARGLAAAEDAARETARRSAAAMTRIAAALEETARGLSRVEERVETEAVEVAVAVARKLAPALMAREPVAEVAALVGECLGHLVSAPHVVVRVNDALYESACSALQAIAAASGFAGKLVILADAEVESGDCRLEWADGGVIRSRARIAAAIDEAVDRYMLRRAHAAANREDTKHA